MVRRWSVVLLLTIQAVLVVWIGWETCPNQTEVGHMGAGVYFWHTLCFDVFCVNPPLTRMITGVPVVMLQPNYDWDCYSSHPQDRSEWAIGNAFVAANSPEKTWWCTVLARWSLIPLLLLGGYFGWRLSREMYGDAAGLVFLILWCFSPLLLAWGATICPDAVAAAMGIVAVYTFRQWLHKPNWIWAAIAGVCLGLLPLTKLTWIIAFGIWPLIWCIWTVPIYLVKAGKQCLPPLRQLAAVLLLGLYVLNMGYLFDGTLRPLGKYVFISRLLRGQDTSGGQQPVAGNRFVGTWLGAIPVPFPADFVQGIDTQRYDFERGLPSYLCGQWADHGWWYYYLYALAIKEPLGTWCLLGLAVGMTIADVWGGWRGVKSKPPSPSVPLPQAGEGSCVTSLRDEMVVLLPGLAILIFVSSQTGFSVHSRYVIPALPFFFVWMSKVGRALKTREETSGQWSVVSGQTDSGPHPLPLSHTWARGEPKKGTVPDQPPSCKGVPVCQDGPTNLRSVTGASHKWGPSPFSTLNWFRNRRQPVLAVLVILALAWSVASSLSIYPHSLSYFNELAAVLPTPADASYPKPEGDSPSLVKRDSPSFVGRNLGQSLGKSGRSPYSAILSTVSRAISAGPRNGPRHLLDSNIDWGQDLFYLKGWLDRHSGVKLDGLAVWGSCPATLAGIPETPMPPTGEIGGQSHFRRTKTGTVPVGGELGQSPLGPQPGWYALSVNHIYSRDRQYRHFLNFEPAALAGYSIYIYHITLDEANRARRKLGLEELKVESPESRVERQADK